MAVLAPKPADVQAYIEASGLRAIAVIPARDDGKSTLSLAPDATPLHVVWFANPSHAELVHDACLDTLTSAGHASDDGTIAVSPDLLRDHVLNTAATLGASFLSKDEIEAQALAAVTAILEKIEAMRLSGGLAHLNASYRNYRLAQQSVGKPAKPYSAFLTDFTRKMITLTAQQATPNQIPNNY